MRRDVTEFQRFYASRLGAVAGRMIGRKLNDAWGPTAGLDVLGLGYAHPWLEPMTEARRAVAAAPGGQGAEAWPSRSRGRVALVEDAALPFPTGLFDRVLAVHALEEAADPLGLLVELGRVLAPAGRLVLVVAGRGGLWARADNTPFGHGRPYTRGQLEGLVREAGLEPFAWSQALYAPPWSGVAGWADALEGLGRTFTPGAAGVVMLEAVAPPYAAMTRVVAQAEPARARSQLAPQGAGRLARDGEAG